MRICAAQTRPVKGDIEKNIENHKKLIDLAIANRAETIIFPELSITGYEPELAAELAIDQTDARLDDFQKIADSQDVTIGIGAPIRSERGVSISMIIFHPQRARQIYSKKYLHTSEDEFFVSGHNATAMLENHPGVALAICYEKSVPEHAENAFQSGAKIYLASVVEDNIEKSYRRLAAIAETYSMTVLMANCVGRTGEYDCPGNSAVWNSEGQLAGQLDETREGVLIFDTETREVIKESVADGYFRKGSRNNIKSRKYI